MKFFKTMATLSPWPRIYTLNPILVGLLSFAGLYGTIHILLVLSGRPMFSDDSAFEIGDPLLAVYMALAAVALKDHRQKTQSFYYSRYWYAVVGIAAVAVNVFLMACGLTQMDTFTLLAVAHFVLVPIYATLVAGVGPTLLFGVKGHYMARIGASASCATYVVTLVHTLGP